MNRLENTYAMNELELTRRAWWRRLGFGIAVVERPASWENLEGYAPSYFMLDSLLYFDWRDRLRILLSGKVHVQCACKTDRIIGRSRVVTKASVLPPYIKLDQPQV